MRSAISASPSPRAIRRSSGCSATGKKDHRNSALFWGHAWDASQLPIMISRRHFFRLAAGLGAFSASTTAYGFAVEPVLRLRVARYDLLPPQWPADFDLRIAVVADLHACDPWMSPERIETIVHRPNAVSAEIIVNLVDYAAGLSLVIHSITSRGRVP